MTQTQTPSWRYAIQAKLMAALDAVWAILERSDDPAQIRQAREKAKAIGDMAAMARKVALIAPEPKTVSPDVSAQVERLARVMAPGLAAEALTSTLVPGAVGAQAEHTRRALEKLKGGGRARL